MGKLAPSLFHSCNFVKIAKVSHTPNRPYFYKGTLEEFPTWGDITKLSLIHIKKLYCQQQMQCTLQYQNLFHHLLQRTGRTTLPENSHLSCLSLLCSAHLACSPLLIASVVRSWCHFPQYLYYLTNQWYQPNHFLFTICLILLCNLGIFSFVRRFFLYNVCSFFSTCIYCILKIWDSFLLNIFLSLNLFLLHLYILLNICLVLVYRVM